MKLEEPIPPEDVKYLSVVWIGECFYVQKNGKEYLVPIGTAGAEDGETAVITENDLRSIAGEYRAYYEDLCQRVFSRSPKAISIIRRMVEKKGSGVLIRR